MEQCYTFYTSWMTSYRTMHVVIRWAIIRTSSLQGGFNEQDLRERFSNLQNMYVYIYIYILQQRVEAIGLTRIYWPNDHLQAVHWCALHNSTSEERHLSWLGFTYTDWTLHYSLTLSQLWKLHKWWHGTWTVST